MWLFLMLEQQFIERILTTSHLHLPILDPESVETCFSIQFTHCIPILSPLPSLTFYQPPPHPRRASRGSVIHMFLVDILLILVRYILHGKMIQWAKIICLITGAYYSLFFLSPNFFCFFIKLRGLYCTELLEGLFPPSGTGIILLL